MDVAVLEKARRPGRLSPSATASCLWRCPSPNLASGVPKHCQLVPKTVVLAETNPTSRCSPSSTPVNDTYIDTLASSRRLSTGHLQENSRPSIMRSLSVSFQSGTISIPVSKREKLVSHPLLDPTHKQAGMLNVLRKPIQEIKSPLQGKTVLDQSETAEPLDGLQVQLADQNRLPNRMGGKLNFILLSTPVPRVCSSGSLEKLIDDSKPRASGPWKLPSPNRSLLPSSSIARDLRPSRPRSSTPARRISPSRRGTSSTSTQSNSSNGTSVLSYIVDVKKGTKGATYIEAAHKLRLLYNGWLQWRLANARAEAVLRTRKIISERTLHAVWNATVSLSDLVISKRMSIQQCKLELKLTSILNDQIPCLEDWALLEKDHYSSLSGAIEDLQASTLNLPVTGGARADVASLSIAISSAVDVMETMGSSIGSLLSKVEKINSLVSELAEIVAQEKTKLDEYEDLLVCALVMQVEEHSLRTHLMQMN